MRFVILLAAIVAVHCMTPEYTQSEEEEFENYKKSYKRNYKPEEEPFRKLIFTYNLEHIEATNKAHKEGKASWTEGINKFTDMLPPEIPKGIPTVDHDKRLNDEFESFKKKFNRHYKPDEEKFRKLIFETNLDKIDSHNRKNTSWTAGVNDFTDLLPRELPLGFLLPTNFTGKGEE